MALNAIYTTCIPCCLSGVGTCKWENGSHVLVTDWRPRCPRCFPAHSHTSWDTARLCFSSGYARPRVRAPPNGPNGAFTEYGKIIRQKITRDFIQLHKTVEFSGPTGFRGSTDPPNGSHGVCWVLTIGHRAPHLEQALPLPRDRSR